MPSPEVLPEDIRLLSRRAALELHHNSFKADLDKLVLAILRNVKEAMSAPLSSVQVATIVISRRNLPNAGDAGRYQVFIDGVRIGELRNNESLSHMVSPGTHTGHFSWGWVKSNML